MPSSSSADRVRHRRGRWRRRGLRVPWPRRRVERDDLRTGLPVRGDVRPERGQSVAFGGRGRRSDSCHQDRHGDECRTDATCTLCQHDRRGQHGQMARNRPARGRTVASKRIRRDRQSTRTRMRPSFSRTSIRLSTSPPSNSTRIRSQAWSWIRAANPGAADTDPRTTSVPVDVTVTDPPAEA